MLLEISLVVVGVLCFCMLAIAITFRRIVNAKVKRTLQEDSPETSSQAFGYILFVYSRHHTLPGYQFEETKKRYVHGKHHELIVKEGAAIVFRMNWSSDQSFDTYFAPHFSIDAGGMSSIERRAIFVRLLINCCREQHQLPVLRESS